MDLRTTRTIRSAIEIRAPLETVWRVLSDFPAYRDWNPHLREIRGRPRQGGRLMVLSQPPGARPLALRPRLVIWRPPHEFRWRATFISRRLFSGEHGFKLEPHGDDRVRFVHDETFRGLLVPLYSLVRLAATRRGFGAMNEALRERAESMTGPHAPPTDASANEHALQEPLSSRASSSEASPPAAMSPPAKPALARGRSLLRRAPRRRAEAAGVDLHQRATELSVADAETPTD